MVKEWETEHMETKPHTQQEDKGMTGKRTLAN